MKRIILVTGASCGGAERITVLFAKILHKAGLNVKLILTCKPHDETPLEDFIPDDLQYEIIHSRYRYLLFYLMKYLWKEKPHIVFCSMPSLLRLLGIIKKLHFPNFYLINRCFNTPSKMSQESYSLFNKWGNSGDIIISQTEEMKDEMIEYFHLPKEKIIVINNPIDKELIHDRIKETFPFDKKFVNYVAIGRIGSQKNYMMLLNAFKLVKSFCSNSRLYIVGSIYEEAYYGMMLKYIEDNNLSSDVFFEGFQSNPFKYTKGADVYCLSSDFEGLPNAMLEAMYLGVPVVATECIPFVAQVVKNGINGYTTSVGDYKSFSEAMLKAKVMTNLDKYIDITSSEEKVVNLFVNARV